MLGNRAADIMPGNRYGPGIVERRMKAHQPSRELGNGRRLVRQLAF
uniref:Uncharacterized protein n=1 Tax=Aquisalinus luteolus TaxID=1566827 RepID=A0A8J3A111_9PROT|nr:hypothetical protein GCM10011355_08700 [Aquisalinus luteolus]